MDRNKWQPLEVRWQTVFDTLTGLYTCDRLYLGERRPSLSAMSDESEQEAQELEGR